MYIINALFPVVLIALLGYLARRRHWLNEPEAAAIERISFCHACCFMVLPLRSFRLTCIGLIWGGSIW